MSVAIYQHFYNPLGGVTRGSQPTGVNQGGGGCSLFRGIVKGWGEGGGESNQGCLYIQQGCHERDKSGG